MNLKRGFTLIELLAVIIILAIVALIATPIILNVVDDARISAGESETSMILSGINNYCATSAMEYQLNGTADICADGVTVDEVSQMVNLGNAKVENVIYNDGKVTNLVVTSNKHKFTLCANGTFVMDDEKCDALATEPEEPSNPESISFAEDSWETIAENIKNGNTNVYSVGDTKEVTLTGELAGTYTVRIANNSTPTECSTEGFSQTACGFVVEFVDIITKYNMNTAQTNSGGWPASEMYDFVNGNIYNALPNDLKNAIIETYSVSGHGSGDSSNFTSNDKLYLLSPMEVWGSSPGYDSAETETRQLDYYKNNGVTLDSYSVAIKTNQGVEDYWWLRAAHSNLSNFFYAVYSSGYCSHTNSYVTLGVAPAFRIG